MSIDWGSYSIGTEGTGLRVGIQLEGTSSVANASSTCVVSFTVWDAAGPGSGDNYDGDAVTIALSATAGALSHSSYSGTVNSSFNGTSGATNEQQGGTQTLTYTYSDYGTAHTVSITAGISGTFNSAAPGKTKAFTIPARPFAAPTAPSAATATRSSDGQINLAWTDHSTASGLYQSVKVYRSTDGGSYAVIASGLSGSATAYSDTSTAAGHKYTYKIEAVNTAGSAQSGATTAVYTTPGAPTGLTATKLGTGDIRLDWTNNVGYGDTAYTVRIEESQNGGAFSELTSVSGGVATYEHVAPSTSVTHTYRVRARSTTGSLNSAYSGSSNTIVLLATANAPTGLSPSGAARDAAGAITLSWTHNPADGTPQSKRHVQYKVDAGSYSDLVNDSSTAGSYAIAAATLTNGHTITWKVATAGQNGTLSAYSAEAGFTLSATPTVTISTPDTTYDTSTLTAAWAYFQAQSSAQATWQASLYDGSSALLEVISGTTEAEGTFTTAVADGATYTVTVTATSAAGLASAADTATFTVAYLPPAAITLTGAFDDTAGSVVLTLTGAAPVTDVTEPITTVDVQRQINGGAWTTLLTGVVLDPVTLTATVQDMLPITVGTDTYRAIAYSALPSSVASDLEDVVTGETAWGYLSGGPDFATVARFRAMPAFAPTTSRAKALYQFAGRPKPVQLAGEALTTTLGVSGKLSEGSGTAADFEALGLAAGVHCWRGPDGRRLFGSLDKMAAGVTRLQELPSISFTLTEVDFTEGDQ